jgi:hypothetical protein
VSMQTSATGCCMAWNLFSKYYSAPMLLQELTFSTQSISLTTIKWVILEGQTRYVTLELHITRAYTSPELPIVMLFKSNNSSPDVHRLVASVPLIHRQSQILRVSEQPVLWATHLVGGSAVQTLTKPPSGEGSRLPIVYLRECIAALCIAVGPN